MFSIIGRHKRTTSKPGGEGAASGNLRVQVPLIADHFPEIRSCHCGTINLVLTHSLIVVKPDFRTPPINWQPQHHPNGEIFDILRVMLEAPIGADPVRAWIYIALNSDHRKTPNTHEVIAPTFLSLPDHSQCRIVIERNVVELPYRANPTIVVV